MREFVNVLPDNIVYGMPRKCLNRFPRLADWENGGDISNILLELRQPVVIHRKAWEYAMCIKGLRQFGCERDDAIGISVGAGSEPPLFYYANKVGMLYATDLYDNPSHEGVPAMLSDPASFSPFLYREDHLDVKAMSGEDLKFDDNTADFVFCLSSIEHFGPRESIRRSFEEMIRVTKPGGVICIITELILNNFTDDEYFTYEEICDIFLFNNSVKIIGGDPEYVVDESRIRYPCDVDGSALNMSPHIVLQKKGMLWTSLSLFFEKI